MWLTLTCSIQEFCRKNVARTPHIFVSLHRCSCRNGLHVIEAGLGSFACRSCVNTPFICPHNSSLPCRCLEHRNSPGSVHIGLCFSETRKDRTVGEKPKCLVAKALACSLMWTHFQRNLSFCSTAMPQATFLILVPQVQFNSVAVIKLPLSCVK